MLASLAVLMLQVAAAAALPCVPKPNHTALLVGQDLGSIRNYSQAFKTTPFGTMVYTTLHNQRGNLTGLLHPIDYGSGVEWADGLRSVFPSSALQIGLYLVDQCTYVVNGALDRQVQELAAILRDWSVDVYLRIGYEFDSSNNHYDTDLYVLAFRRIVAVMRNAGASNVAAVWHASGFPPRDNINITSWFPGTDFVDWCGVSIFQQPYECTSHVCNMEAAERLVQFCSELHLPVMIAESTPYGGIVGGSKDVNGCGIEGSTWSSWFRFVIEFIKKHDIRMWCYINCDWDTQSMWREQHAPGQYWGDTRLETAPADIRRRWEVEVMLDSRFSWSVNWTTAPSDIKILNEDFCMMSTILSNTKNYVTRSFTVILVIALCLSYCGLRCLCDQKTKRGEYTLIR
jgi:hypothetical protein